MPPAAAGSGTQVASRAERKASRMAMERQLMQGNSAAGGAMDVLAAVAVPTCWARRVGQPHAG